MTGLFLLVCSSFENTEAATSPVTIASDIYSADILVSEFMVATLTIENADNTTYRTLDAYLVVHWPTGVAWNIHFLDADYNVIEDYKINISKGGSATVKFIVFCDDICSAGDTNTVLIFAKTDPKFYNYDGNITDTCGSDDCETDSSPASASSNFTNTIAMTFTAREAYASSIMCDVESSEGDNEVTSGNATIWNYTLTNIGWNDDFYQFTSVVTSADGHNVGYWTVNPGMTDGRGLAGQNASGNADHAVDSVITIVPANNATSGVYNIELAVTSTNGAQPAGCNFDVIVPGSETEEETTGDPANETAEEEIETLPEEEIEEVPSISLIPALISFGIIALRRRY
jgi:hypothetical protein